MNSVKIALNYIMILYDESYAFFVTFLENKTYALCWTNQQSKSCGIGQKKNSGPLRVRGRRYPWGTVNIEDQVLNQFISFLMIHFFPCLEDFGQLNPVESWQIPL